MVGDMSFYRVRDVWWDTTAAKASIGDLKGVCDALLDEYPEFADLTSEVVAALATQVDSATVKRLDQVRSTVDLRGALDGVLFGAMVLFGSAFTVVARDRQCPLDDQRIEVLLKLLDRDVRGLRAWLSADDLAKFTSVLGFERIGRVPIAELSALAAYAGEPELATWARVRSTEGVSVLLSLSERVAS